MTTDSHHPLHWFPMRITYGRNERMFRFKEQLDAEGLENFLPLRYQYDKTEDWDVRQELVPAVHGLIFIRSTRQKLTELKMTRREFEPMHYMTNQLREDENERILTVPDRQMENFMRVASVRDGRVVFLDYTEFITKPGKRVRITDRHKKSVLTISYDSSWTAGRTIRRNHRHSHSHGFQQRIGKSLIIRAVGIYLALGNLRIYMVAGSH